MPDITKTEICMKEMMEEYRLSKMKYEKKKENAKKKELLEFEEAWINAGLQVVGKDKKK
jgi:hypothetical protein